MLAGQAIMINWIVLLEGVSLEALNRACSAWLAEETLHQHGCTGAVERETYSVQLAVSKPR